MKILCLIDTLGMGGAERQMIGLATLLKECGYTVDLVTYYNHDFYMGLAERNGITCHTLSVQNSRWSKLQAIRKYIQASGGYDWVIAYKDGPTVIGCLLKCLGGRFRLIVSERNTNQNITRGDRLKFFLYRFADYIVPNAYSQEQFIKTHFPGLSPKVVTITNFTDTDYFQPKSEVRPQIPIVLTAARIALQKNVLNYMQAIALLKAKGVQAKFEWYGDVQPGEEEYGKQVFSLRLQLGIEDMLTFYPATSNIITCYQQCDIFCLPSVYEGFPNVVCEAMACGKPVVCSRVCDNPYIVQENENGVLFDPNDVNDIAEKLTLLLSMSAQQQAQMGLKSREIAERLFSKSAFVDKYIHLIEHHGQ